MPSARSSRRDKTQLRFLGHRAPELGTARGDGADMGGRGRHGGVGKHGGMGLTWLNEADTVGWGRDGGMGPTRWDEANMVGWG